MALLATSPTQEFELFRRYVAEHCGITLGQEKGYLLESRLAHLLVQTQSDDLIKLYHHAQNDLTGRLREQIIDAITTHETYWFRDTKPWAAVEKAILPALAAELREGRKSKVRIWSAACSSGQEAYSLTMLIDKLITNGTLRGVRPEQFEIVGTDISTGTILLAQNAIYNQIEIIRGLEPAWRDKYFTQNGPRWQLTENIRKRVIFRKHNLQHDLRALGSFDFVLCRNVAIYFEESFKKDLFHRIKDVMQPRGFLLLGATESLMSVGPIFQHQQAEGASYYQKP